MAAELNYITIGRLKCQCSCDIQDIHWISSSLNIDSFVFRARWPLHLSGRSSSICRPLKPIPWSLWGSTVSVSASSANFNGFMGILFNRWASHSAAIEVGPQPNGVLRADVYNLMKEALDLIFEFVQEFNAGEKQCFYLFIYFLTYFRVGKKNSKITAKPPFSDGEWWWNTAG